MISTIKIDQSHLSSFNRLLVSESTPIFQGDFVHGFNNQLWNYNYVFNITAPSIYPTNGSIYSNNSGYFVCTYSTGSTMVCYSPSPPTSSGVLTKISGTGDASVSYSSFLNSVGVTYGTGATIDTNLQRARIQSGTGSTNFAYFNSKKISRYRAGEGMEAYFTPVFNSGVTNNIQFLGLYSLSGSSNIYDGFGLGYSGTSFGILYYNSGNLNFIPQTSSSISFWNGDKVDDSTGSFKYDPTKGSPVRIRYPYLGYGNINFDIQNPVTGEWTLIHSIKYANTSINTELSNPSLCIGGFTINFGNTTNITMYMGCVSLLISGKYSSTNLPKNSFDIIKSNITTEVPLFTLKNGIYYNGVSNKAMSRILSFGGSAIASNSSNCILKLKFNATLSGSPSFFPIEATSIDVTGLSITGGNSTLSVDISSNMVSGGKTLISIPLNSGGAILKELENIGIELAPGDTLTCTATSTSASTISANINWVENI